MSKKSREGFALAKPTLAVCLLVLAAPALARAEPNRAALTEQHATLQAEVQRLDDKLEGLLQQNQARIIDLQGRLTRLRQTYPRPQAEIDRVRADLARADELTLGLIEGHRKLREPIEQRLSDVQRQLAELPPEPETPPASTPWSSESAAKWHPDQGGAGDVLLGETEQGQRVFAKAVKTPDGGYAWRKEVEGGAPYDPALHGPIRPARTTQRKLEKRNGLGNLLGHHLNGDALDGGSIALPVGPSSEKPLVIPRTGSFKKKEKPFVIPRTGSPPPAEQRPPPKDLAQRRALARKLTRAGGSGDAGDVALVVKELVKLPLPLLEQLWGQGTQVVVGRGSVTDVRPDLKGTRPRGWDEGKTWDQVPGVYLPGTNEVVIATRGHGTPEGPRVPRRLSCGCHGSGNLVLHEAGHALDKKDHYVGSRNKTSWSKTPEFAAARSKDLGALSRYERQAGKAGPQETYAEGLARYYGGDPTMERDTPNLYRYFKDRDPTR